MNANLDLSFYEEPGCEWLGNIYLVDNPFQFTAREYSSEE